MRGIRTGLVVALAVAMGAVGAPATAAGAGDGIPVQVLAFTDLHGRIIPTTGAQSRLVTGPGPNGKYGEDKNGNSDDEVVRVGGAAYLATTVSRLQSSFRRSAGGSAASFLVSAGDVGGSSPEPIAKYRDEPSIEVANTIGLDVSAAGDDEFQHGTRELRRISAATDGKATDDVTACEGVTPGKTGCFGEGKHAFTGAKYPYLAANVLDRRTRRPILPPYQVLYTPLGVKVALIGVVTQNLPNLAPAKGLADVTVIDEADAVNRWVPQLRSQGVEAIGVLIHEGAQRKGPAALDANGCEGVVGPITSINERIDPAVDFIVSGYTHVPYICKLPVPGGQPRLVTHAGAYGRVVTDIRLTLDPSTGDVDRKATYSAKNVANTRLSADARVQALVDYWAGGSGSQAAAQSGPLEERASKEPSDSGRGSVLGSIALLAAVALPLGALWIARRRRARLP